jgi:hypothetical protein
LSSTPLGVAIAKPGLVGHRAVLLAAVVDDDGSPSRGRHRIGTAQSSAGACDDDGTAPQNCGPAYLRRSSAIVCAAPIPSVVATLKPPW